MFRIHADSLPDILSFPAWPSWPSNIPGAHVLAFRPSRYLRSNTDGQERRRVKLLRPPNKTRGRTSARLTVSYIPSPSASRNYVNAASSNHENAVALRPLNDSSHKLRSRMIFITVCSGDFSVEGQSPRPTPQPLADHPSHQLRAHGPLTSPTHRDCVLVFVVSWRAAQKPSMVSYQA